jgi:serralysin
VGGEGADVFQFAGASDSQAAAFDVIADFQTGIDKLFLGALRAGGSDALRIDQFDGYAFLSVDQGGDGSVDFVLQVNGVVAPGDYFF